MWLLADVDIDKESISPRWLWKGALNSDGYGILSYRGRRMYAHRFFYEQLSGMGTVPLGLEIDHLCCNNRACVSPWHLEPVTHSENMRRMHQRCREARNSG